LRAVPFIIILVNDALYTILCKDSNVLMPDNFNSLELLLGAMVVNMKFIA